MRPGSGFLHIKPRYRKAEVFHSVPPGCVSAAFKRMGKRATILPFWASVYYISFEILSAWERLLSLVWWQMPPPLCKSGGGWSLIHKLSPSLNQPPVQTDSLIYLADHSSFSFYKDGWEPFSFLGVPALSLSVKGALWLSRPWQVRGKYNYLPKNAFWQQW